VPGDSHLRPPRPRPVTVASWLLLGLAAFAALETAVTASTLRHFAVGRDAFVAAAGSGDQILSSLAELHGDLVYDTTLAVISGLVLGVLGVAVRRPSRFARLITCCVAGFIAVALIIGFGASPENVIPVESTSPAPVRQAAGALLYAWYPSWQSIVASLEILGLVGVAALLMTSTAGDYYRRLRIDERVGTWTFQPGARD
jgi:hypothetical protein